MLNNIIKSEKNKIRNSELIVAAATKNLELVIKLIDDGAEVSYMGSGGNTSLHCAAINRSVDISKFLLSKGANVYIENEDGQTPFDYVCNERNENDKAIKVELQKYFIEKAFSVVENYVHKKESSQLKDVCEDTEVSSDVMICAKGLNLMPYNNEESSFLKEDIFREENKKKEKLKSCLRYLKSLNDEGKIPLSNTNSFTYEQANIFIFFLEAVAFQDVELSEESKIQIIKDFEKKSVKINSESEKEIQKEINKKRAQIVKIIKDYFTSTFYPPNFEEDLKLVDVARTLLCHSSNKIITLDDVRKLVCPGTTMISLFSKLYEYVSYICYKIGIKDLPNTKSCQTIDLTSLLMKIKKQDNLDIGLQGVDILEEELGKLIMATYNQEEWTRERTQEILFSFLVNISPAFGKEVSDLNTLRNKIIHEFHKYRDVDSIIKMEFEETVCDLWSKLFKYYYAKVVYKILHEIRPSDDSEDIKNNLNSALKEFEEKFGKKFKIASQEDADGSFEYRLSPSEMMSSTINEITEQDITEYLKFMTIVDDVEIKHGNENPQHFNNMTLENQCAENQQNSDEDNNEFEKKLHLKDYMDSKISSINKLDILKRKKIFDKFSKFEKLYKSLPRPPYLQEINVFKTELAKNYGVNELYFDVVCKMYVERNDDLPLENLIHVSKIGNIIMVIRKFQSEFSLSLKYITFLYKRVVEGIGIYDLENSLGLLKNKKITMSKVEKFQREIFALHKDDIIDVTIFDTLKVKLNVVKTVSNILMMFCNTYNSYQTKFNNIEEAFKDKFFLDNMVEQEKIYQKKCADQNKNFEFCYYKHMIFKKLLKIKYTAPYIVRSITEEGNENVMEKKDMIELMQSLLENNDYMDQVSELLKVNCEGVNLYRSVLKKLLESGVAEMRQIFEEPIHVEKILEILKEFNSNEETKINFKNEVTKLLNDIVSNLYSERNYGRALELLGKYLPVGPVQDAEVCSLELLEAQRLEARIRNRKGSSLNRKSGIVEHEKALNILLSIEEKLEQNREQLLDMKPASIYFLTLSHLSNTYHLLGNHADSVNKLEKLYDEIKCFSLDMSTRIYKETDRLEGYNNLLIIVQLKKYADLLAFSDENKVYLDVLKIQKYIGSKKSHQSRTERLTKRALELLINSLDIFKDVYFVQKKIKSPDISEVSDTTMSIGTICFHLAQFYSRFFPEDSDAIKNYCAESILYYTIMNKEWEKLQLDQFTIMSNNSVTYIYKTLYSILNCETMSLDPVLKEKLVNKQSSFQKYFPSTKLQKVKYNCEPSNTSDKNKQSKTENEFKKEVSGGGCLDSTDTTN